MKFFGVLATCFGALHELHGGFSTSFPFQSFSSFTVVIVVAAFQSIFFL
jgi:hypothetical protein